MQRGLHLGLCRKTSPGARRQKPPHGPPSWCCASGGSVRGGPAAALPAGPSCVVVGMPPCAPPPRRPRGGLRGAQGWLGVQCVVVAVRNECMGLARGAYVIKGKGHAKLGLDSTTAT